MAFLNLGTLNKPSVHCFSARYTPRGKSDGVTEYISLMATDHDSQLQEEARRCVRQQRRYWDYPENKLIVLSAFYTRPNGFSGQKVSVLDRESFLICFEDVSLLRKKILEESRALIDEWHKQPKSQRKASVSKEYPIKQHLFQKNSRRGYKTGKSLQTLILTTYSYTEDFANRGPETGPLDLSRLDVYIKIQSTAMQPYQPDSQGPHRDSLHFDVFGFGVGVQTFLDMLQAPIFSDFKNRVQGWAGPKLATASSTSIKMPGCSVDLEAGKFGEEAGNKVVASVTTRTRRTAKSAQKNEDEEHASLVIDETVTEEV